MSDLVREAQRESDWENWLEENEYVHRVGEFYECPGNHIWHISDLTKLFNEEMERKHQ